uniref:ABC transporter substrate-binding protein n=1 Tax=Ferrimicrobium acidiphilum TaxID=121039 RepID=UPI0023F14034
MYRPLYFYGKGNKAEIDYNLSIGNPPVYSNNDKTVTVTLKHYEWSNGTPVTARDVIFWMNLLKANKTSYGAYVPGAFPDNVVSYSAPNPSTVVFQLNRSYNPTWFTYNELSQITPLPIAWDRTSLSQPAPSPNAQNLPDTTTAGAQA